MAQTLGILLAAPPGHPDAPVALGLIEASLKQGNTTSLYLIDEGVRHFGTPAIRVLQEQGLRLFVCAYGAQNRGIAPTGEAVFGGLANLADLIRSSDRFLAFTGMPLEGSAAFHEQSPSPGQEPGYREPPPLGSSSPSPNDVPPLLFLIRSDPRKDRRVAEAIRIAAGVSTGLRCGILLEGDGAYLFTEDPEDLADGSVMDRFLPILADGEIPLWADPVAWGYLKAQPPEEFSISPLDAEQIPVLLSQARFVMVF